MKLWNDLRAAVNASDVCDSASAELDYAADDDSDTNDTAAETCETAQEAEATR